MSGTGLAAAASATSFPFIKLRLAQENSPLWSRAYSPAVSFSCVTAFPGKSPASHRTTAARACWPGVRPTGSTNQTKPCSQSSRGRKTRHPAQSPRRRRRGRMQKKRPRRFWMRSPPSAGQSGQFPIMPCGAPGREPAGPGNDVGEVQPACGRSSQQTFDIAVLRRKGDARPELNPFHGRKLLFL